MLQLSQRRMIISWKMDVIWMHKIWNIKAALIDYIIWPIGGSQSEQPERKNRV